MPVDLTGQATTSRAGRGSICPGFLYPMLMRFLPWLVTSALLVACGSSNSATHHHAPGDAGSDQEAAPPPNDGGSDAPQDAPGGYPADHPPMPKALTKGGPVMPSVKLVPISFSGDSLEASLDKFATQLAAAKTYWAGTTSEYGVGALTTATPIHLTETAAASLTDADVQTWLTGKIKGGNGFPQPDASTLYVIYYPSTTDVVLQGGHLCSSYQGYHSDYLMDGTTEVIYTVVGRCPPMGNVSAMDEISAEASHEFIEAATDPYPNHKPAYTDIDDKAWAILAGGEIGDVCSYFPDSFYRPTGVDNLVQRVWSNASAAAGHGPCEPDAPSPYFNSGVVMPDTISSLNSPIGPFTSRGVKIPIGQSKTLEVDLYSDGPTSGPWTVKGVDLSSAFFASPPSLQLTFDKTAGKNGDKLKLTIKALRASSFGAAPFWVESTLGSTSTYWLGLVANN